MAGNFCTNCGEAFRSPDQKFCAMCGHPSSGVDENLVTNSPVVSQDLLGLKFAGQPFEGFSEDAFTFRNANVLLVGTSSQKWFPGDYVSIQEISPQLTGETPEWISDYTIHPWFLDGEAFFNNYESILWKDSKFGERFLKVLASRGANVVRGYLGRTAQFEDENGVKQEVAISTPIDFYVGRWGLSDGTEFSQKGQVFRSKVDGHEIVYWNIDALATTRPSIEPILSKYSHRILIPHFLQVATYLAETPFPSALSGSMGLASRETIFGENVSVTPRPVTRFITDSYLLGLQKDATGSMVVGCWAPEIYQQGYVFSDEMSDEDIYESLPTVCDGLPKIAEIIVDGYANWPVDTDLDFQISLRSDLSICLEPECFSYGAIVPGIMYGKLFFKANHVYDTNYKNLHESLSRSDLKKVEFHLDALKEIADEGVGSVFLHAANSFAATAMEVGFDWEFDKMLEDFSKIDVDSQGLNALSNLIVSKSKRQDFQRANTLIDRALKMCKRRGPNLETISHFTTWDGSVESPIILEVYESAIKVKRHLGLDQELKYVAQEIVDYCTETKIDIDLLREAKLILTDN